VLKCWHLGCRFTAPGARIAALVLLPGASPPALWRATARLGSTGHARSQQPRSDTGGADSSASALACARLLRLPGALML
jgi:hypothetical protein